MLPWHSHGSEALGLPAYCEPQGGLFHWLSRAFDTCVPTPLALITTMLGSLSFLAWLFAQLPQIYKNYKLQSASGLSIYFLIEWLLGDTTNLVGAVLTKQASWQILIASYYTFVDIVLVLQFIYYTQYRPWKRRKARAGKLVDTRRHLEGPSRALREERTAPRPIGGQKNVPEPRPMWPFGSFHFPGLSLSPYEKSPTPTPTPDNRRYLRVPANAPSAVSPKTVLMISLMLAVVGQAAPAPISNRPVFLTASREKDQLELAGRIISWISTFMYLGSRLPQIFKNARRRSTAGLSLSLFVAAFFGNLFYSTSLLTNPLAWGSYPPHGYYGWAGANGSDRMTWVQLALPFWLGAAGVLSLDLTIGLQFLMYDDGEEQASMVPTNDADADGDADDERGRQAWRKVSGWMRGWIPSPSGMLRSGNASRNTSRPRGASTFDDERPLLAREDSPSAPFQQSRAYGSSASAAPRT